MTKATFLMTAYNSQKTIAEAVHSVLNQSYKEFELIIVNDASTDDTSQIISSIHDSRIQLITNQSNLYITEAANIGLENVKTAYLLRIDSDDICMPNRLKLQLDFMEKNPQIGVCGSFVKFTGDKNDNWMMPCSNNEIKAYMLYNNCFANSSVIIRMDVLRQNNLKYSSNYLYPPMEDYDLWFRMMPFTQFANLPVVLVKKRWHNNSMSVKHAAKSDQNNCKFFNDHLPAFGIDLNAREIEIHSFLSSNFKVGKPDASPIEYANYFKKMIAQAELNPLFDQESIKSICVKKWMLLTENIKLTQYNKVKAHLSLTRELFGENLWQYFIKKKIRQILHL